jgi:hypothetical protein
MMKYATAGAFRTALEQRLSTASKESGLSVQRLRKLVVRLLARLLAAAPDRWLLKGGLALDLRLGTRARTTKDMDLARGDSEDAATADLLAAQALDLGDYFIFAAERTNALDALLDGAAVRYRVMAELAGRRFEEVVIDIGFGDPVDPPDIVSGPALLNFAGIEPIAIPVVSLDQHVAEKIHAYTRIYSDGRTSSRVKDLIDLVLIRSSDAFVAGRLRAAIRITFERRGTHPPPASLPRPPDGWGPPYRRLAREVGLGPDVLVGHRLAGGFLDPVLGGAMPDDAAWDPTRGRWDNQ